MTLINYPVYCIRAGCGKPAEYKIASAWSDGATQEYKTFSLSCMDCLEHYYQEALAKHAHCRLASDETLAEPGIYLWSKELSAKPLTRAKDLEAKYAS